MGLTPAGRLSLFCCGVAFMNASYTLIAGLPALTVGVFTPARGSAPAKGESHKLQNRDNHRDPGDGWQKVGSLT